MLIVLIIIRNSTDKICKDHIQMKMYKIVYLTDDKIVI